MGKQVVFFIGFIILIGTNSMEAATKNLTAITWGHAINSQELLKDALSSDIDYIEADIVMGTIKGSDDKTEMPVMGHPPAIESDISLKEFLEKILDFNNLNADKKKGVKLDFKTIGVFNGSLDLLMEMWDKMTYPVWINADIVQGPLENTATIPVNPDQFFEGAKNFAESVLSIGWTTRWGPDFTIGNYTDSQINEMITTITANSISHDITFPVRAGIAAQSESGLKKLFAALETTNNVTLTIWSSAGDFVNIKQLRSLIFSFGLDKVYLDVPEEVSSQLNLGNSGNSRAASFSILGLGLAVLSLFKSF